jgi:hypothetical protein
MLDAANPPGNRVYWKSAVLRNTEDDVLDAIVDGAASIPRRCRCSASTTTSIPQGERH